MWVIGCGQLAPHPKGICNSLPVGWRTDNLRRRPRGLYESTRFMYTQSDWAPPLPSPKGPKLSHQLARSLFGGKMLSRGGGLLIVSAAAWCLSTHARSHCQRDHIRFRFIPRCCIILNATSSELCTKSAPPVHLVGQRSRRPLRATTPRTAARRPRHRGPPIPSRGRSMSTPTHVGLP